MFKSKLQKKIDGHGTNHRLLTHKAMLNLVNQIMSKITAKGIAIDKVQKLSGLSKKKVADILDCKETTTIADIGKVAASIGQTMEINISDVVDDDDLGLLKDVEKIEADGCEEESVDSV